MLRNMHVTIISLLLLLPLCVVQAQEKAESEVSIHNNVRLLEMPVPKDMPEEFKAKYQAFVQQLKDAIKEKTAERAAASAYVFQVRPGIKEVGLNRTKRPMASLVAYRKDSKSEYCGDILLHSYASGENVSQEEVNTFLSRQFLAPLALE